MFDAQKNVKHVLLLPVVSHVHQGIIYNLIRQVFPQDCASLAPRMFFVRNARSLITFVLHAWMGINFPTLNVCPLSGWASALSWTWS